MFFALDKNDNRIGINDAIKGEKYFCPICNGELVVKDGKINAKHFAHLSSCVDSWHYDLSEWHLKMQSFFPKENREVVVFGNGKHHRADILIDKTVIEFQHSPISAEEYKERTDFFLSLGYRIAWVFDVDDQWKNKKLFFYSQQNDNLITWLNPLRFFSVGPQVYDNNKNFSVWLYWEDDGEYSIINKVVWALPKNDFKRLAIGKYCINLNDFDINEFFYCSKDYIQERISSLEDISYEIKYSNERNHQRESYICNRFNKFGIKIFGDYGCAYCQHCHLIIKTKQSSYKIYCCYPNKVRELDGTEEGFECSSNNIIMSE